MMGSHSGENTKDKRSKANQIFNKMQISRFRGQIKIRLNIHFGNLITRNNMNNLYTSQTKNEPCRGFLLFKILDNLVLNGVINR